MIEPSQENDFSSHKTNTFWIDISEFDLLQGNNFVSFKITSSVNTAVSTLANLQEASRINEFELKFEIMNEE